MTIDTQDWSNVIFSQVRAISDQQFYLIVQDNFFVVKIYSCLINPLNDQSINCGAQPQGRVRFNGKINVFGFTRWYAQDSWYAVDLYNDIYIYDFFGYAIASFSDYENQYQIIDIKTNGNQIFVLYQSQKMELLIDFRSFDIDF